MTNNSFLANSAEMASKADSQLALYRSKRNRNTTTEPFTQTDVPETGALFVVQQHLASHLHWDLRIEVDGVLKSWAVPKGPSTDPADKRFAVETEDHPLDYANFEGEIPPGNYGAGSVIVWDRGHYTMKGEYVAGLQKGKLLFELHGFKLRGLWTLVRLKTKNSNGREWLLIKEHDHYVGQSQAQSELGGLRDESVLSGLRVEQLTKPNKSVGALKRRLKQSSPIASSEISTISTKPMLATAGSAHNRKGWLWELKYDGYRILAYKDGVQLKLLTRNGNDVAQRFPEICQTLQHLPIDQFILDGELVVNDSQGRPSFQLMQTRAAASSAHQVKRWAIECPATYYAFDLLYALGQDVRELELLRRKALLRSMVPPHGYLVYSEHVVARGKDTFHSAQELGVEGVVGKRANGRYQAARSQDWIKVRNNRTQEFVVVGWSGSGERIESLSSIAVAEFRGDTLHYTGHVGSGLAQHVREALITQLRRQSRKTSPVSPTPTTKKHTHWVTPKCVVEVAFTEYTQRGHLRHPSLQRLRADKLPKDCVSQQEVPTISGSPESSNWLAKPEEIVVTTNPEKEFFPAYTKADLVRYYRKIATWMLPYLIDRPLVLTRYPDGITGKSFYQRDVPAYVPDWIQRETLWSESSSKEVQYLIARSPEDLAYLANLGTIPIHIWHSTLHTLAHPDWCVLDLDPKQADFKNVLTLALATRDLAEEIGLPAYLKTSGVSGLHVLLPLARQLTHVQAQTLGELLAQVLVERHGDIATTARTVKKRQNKVYLDYLQNGPGKLIAAPYAARAETAASVSMPLKWSEAHRGLSNSKFHIGNALRRMQRLGDDPMANLLTDQPDLLRALGKLTELL